MDQPNEMNTLQASVEQPESFGSKAFRVLRGIGRWIFHLRGLWLAVPVAIVAFWMAAYNTVNLPEEVGLLLLASGEYQWTVARGTAVLIPLVVTGGCLVLTFCSRRTIYPWLISIFTLILPVLIYVTNVFPA